MKRTKHPRPGLIIELFDAKGNKVEDPWQPESILPPQPPPLPPPPTEVWRMCLTCNINGGAFGASITNFFNKAFNKRHTHGVVMEVDA